jgi:F0F1-type ATP synthase membrane subunit a
LFVGTIQAYVFAMLALIFIQMAMSGHGAEKESPH